MLPHELGNVLNMSFHRPSDLRVPAVTALSHSTEFADTDMRCRLSAPNRDGRNAAGCAASRRRPQPARAVTGFFD
jgi:hypothetical protein